MADENKPKWTMERVHAEIAEARTKLFVVAKVLETGGLTFTDNQEWALVVDPLLRDILTNAGAIQSLVREAEEQPAE